MEVDNNYRECKLIDKNLEALEDDVFSPCLQKSVDSVIKNEGYKTYNVFKRQISTDGGNYLGLLYEVDVKGKTEDGDKETNIFIKNIITNDAIKLLSITEAYQKETYAYKELSKIYMELQDSANVPQKERFKMAKAYDESNSEAIILENLTRKGFKTGHRMEVMSLKFAELCVQQLARFHALSYVLQEKQPEYYEKKLKILKQGFIFNDDFDAAMENMCQMSSEPLDSIAKEKLEKSMPKFSEKFEQYLRDTDSVGCCICHGDYRVNNILVKEVNGEAAEVIPVDYQLLYHGCPVNDFIFFIFTASNQLFRKLYLDDLKDLYHDTLDKFLSYFDMDVGNIYPKKEFERQFKEKLDYGLITMLFGTAFIFAEDDDILDLTKDDMSTATVRLNKNFEERIRGIVDDYIQWGYL